MKKNAFTILEMLLAFTLVMLIAGTTIPMIYKKNFHSNYNDTVHRLGSWVCDCDDGNPNVRTERVGNTVVRYCDFDADEAVKTGARFFAIKLIGGGAAAGPHRGGTAGESRTVYYPAMSGMYRAVLGKGGSKSDSTNGGITALYKIDGNNFTLLESVVGGTVTNEECRDDVKICPFGQTSCADSQKGCYGEFPAYSKAAADGKYYISDDEKEFYCGITPLRAQRVGGADCSDNCKQWEEINLNGETIHRLKAECANSCGLYCNVNKDGFDGDVLSDGERSAWREYAHHSSCGAGGNIGSDGIDGEVVISWE